MIKKITGVELLNTCDKNATYAVLLDVSYEILRTPTSNKTVYFYIFYISAYSSQLDAVDKSELFCHEGIVIDNKQWLHIYYHHCMREICLNPYRICRKYWHCYTWKWHMKYNTLVPRISDHKNTVYVVFTFLSICPCVWVDKINPILCCKQESSFCVAISRFV